MNMLKKILFVTLITCAVLGIDMRAWAARPLLDQHQWDAYFALYARDTSVPWKPTTLRLDTYSSAPVDFTAYEIDPAEVIVAGVGHTARVLSTSRLHPAAQWRFDPPSGYRFVSSDVDIPLGQRAGFFVIEARRGNVARQIWIERTRIGLEAKVNSHGLLLWAVDLGTGKPLENLSISLLVGNALVDRRTAHDGTIVWRTSPFPRFALAQMNSDRAFLSFLPQAPISQSLVGVRLATSVVRAGDQAQVVGFARVRVGSAYVPAKGSVHLTLVDAGKTLETQTVPLDAAGAFSSALPVPESAHEGEETILVESGRSVAGTNVEIDARSDVDLRISQRCPCLAGKDVFFDVIATRAGKPVSSLALNARVVRSPHVRPPGTTQENLWGTAVIFDQAITTNALGKAEFSIAAPTDGLASTYGVEVRAPGTTERRVLSFPTGPIGLAISADPSTVGPGDEVGIDVQGFDPVSGLPAVGGIPVIVRLQHGPDTSQVDVRLDAHGHAHVVLRPESLGTSLASVEIGLGNAASASDITSITVTADAHFGASGDAGQQVRVSTERERYQIGDFVDVNASLPGGQGDALLTLQGEDVYFAKVLSLNNGHVESRIRLGDVSGSPQIGLAVVRDGTIVDGTAGLAVDAPGRPRLTSLTLDRASYDPGANGVASIQDGNTRNVEATVAIRIAGGDVGNGAYFGDAPLILAASATNSQDSAAPSPAWHAWVAAEGSAGAQFFGDTPTRAATGAPTVGAAPVDVQMWSVQRNTSGTIDFQAPAHSGRYVFSILKMSDDGSVGAASIALVVK
ncbi:MAG TPA: hypothetical protein VGZ00_01750 [Candidatus Baltobacteraceae bacterium]|jgi:hypothetical protein|nr:hypothetical protein [Candidatus Baltobacteraceae bacterium]